MSSGSFSFQCESIGDFPTKKSHDELRILPPCQAAQQVSAAECYPQNSPTGNSQMNYFGAPVEDGAYPLVISHSHGIDGPFIDGLPIKNGDFPWLCSITRG